jgi:hypothetical protein
MGYSYVATPEVQESQKDIRALDNAVMELLLAMTAEITFSARK